ncbi:hypothetical protein A2U01_0083339, partial [Trifolium medium]|nr:hypothetical protein [Trifolium medium]
VKVRGIRFDIRIIEEAGSWPESGGGCVRMGPVWHEAQSSRASFGVIQILQRWRGVSRNPAVTLTFRKAV